MKTEPVAFTSDEITLEGVWHYPEAISPLPGVIVCHPHPLYGGDMNNGVVLAICRELAQRQIAALRFNFRGVGRSGGNFSNGIGEQEDVKAAISFALESSNTANIGLAGYSFGASVALPVALKDERVSLLAMVSPALSESDWEQLKSYPGPSLIISGEDDLLVPASRIRQLAKEVSEPKNIEIIEGADHFWNGHEASLAKNVTGYFLTGFKPREA